MRIPVRWDKHTGVSPPYTIDTVFMERVAQVVGWSLGRGLVTVVNSHHDDWLDNQTTFDAGLPRFQAIWTQISQRFTNAPEILLFEIFNEPHVMSIPQLNAMNAAVHPIVRKYNPTRILLLGGLQWMSPGWQVQHPGQMFIPHDSQLMVEIHSYDPPGFAMCGDAIKNGCPIKNWGSDADVAALNKWMDDISKWSEIYHLPIFYGEFGCTHLQNASTGRDVWYKAHAEGIAAHGFAAAVWDDDGNYRLYDRNADSWDAGVLAAMGKIVPPPQKSI